MKLFTAFTTKGGVGKSFLNQSLAAAMVRLRPNARVALIDAATGQGSLSTTFAPDRDRQGVGIGKALLRVLEYQNAPHAKYQGILEAQEILKQSTVEVGVIPKKLQDSRYTNQGKMSFIPAATLWLTTASMNLNLLPNPQDPIIDLLEPFDETWDIVIIDLGGHSRDNGLNKGILACMDAIVVPFDVRNPRNHSGMTELVEMLKSSARLVGKDCVPVVGGFANYIGDNDLARNGYALAEELARQAFSAGMIGKGLRSLPSIGNTTEVYEKGSDIFGGMYYELSTAVHKNMRKVYQETIQDIEAIASKLLEAADSANSEIPDALSANRPSA